jgi:hypothetical protein
VVVAGWAVWKSEDWTGRDSDGLPTYKATILGDMSSFSQKTAKHFQSVYVYVEVM